MRAGSGEDYSIIRSLGETGHEQRYEARAPEGLVILKVLCPSEADARGIERLENEHRIAAWIGTSSVVRSLGITRFRGMPALVVERVEGTSLERRDGEPMEIGRFLKLAVAA